MAIVFQDTNIPLAPGYPLPALRYDPANYHFRARLYLDDSWGSEVRPYCLYFHGSGSTEPLTGPLLDGLIGAGITVVATMALGVWESSDEPFRYNYGNVNAPNFISHFIEDAWWVESAYRAVQNSPSPIVILGHSQGASAALTWAAGYTGRSTFPTNVKGVVASGATVAGLGDLSWNDVNRSINTLSGIVALLKGKTILAYGDDDEYAPPDFARHLQLAIPDCKDTYVVTPGSAPHNWTTSAGFSQFAVQWVTQLANDEQITDRLGNPAVPGPVIQTT